MTSSKSRPAVSLSWSSGKDAALALQRVLQAGQLEVISLHTSLNQETQQVGMHGSPQALVAAQARAIGLPLEVLPLPTPCSNRQYEEVLLAYYSKLRQQGVEGVVFGDILLEDLRQYREGLLQRAGLQGYYPLWQQPTARLAREVQQQGIKAVVCAASSQFFGPEAVGCPYDQHFLEQLPPGCDPCGEGGEFHTFVTEAPFFSQPVALRLGQTQLVSYALSQTAPATAGMWMAELLPTA